MVTAVKEADFSFLDLTKSKVETSRFEVGGLTSNAAHYQSFLYGDRNLYRPGDTVRTNTVIRTEDWKNPPTGLPLKIRLLPAYRQGIQQLAAEAGRGRLVREPLYSAAQHHDRAVYPGGAHRQRRAAHLAQHQRGRIHPGPPEGDCDGRPRHPETGPGRDGHHHGPQPVWPAGRRPQVRGRVFAEAENLPAQRLPRLQLHHQ